MNSIPAQGRIHRRGFTLLEMLVTVAVIGVLAAFLFSSLSSSRKKAERAASHSKIRGFLAVAGTYSADHDGYLPPPTSREWGEQGPDGFGKEQHWVEYFAKTYAGANPSNFAIRPGDDLKWTTNPGQTRKVVASDGTEYSWSYAMNVSIPYPANNPGGYTDVKIKASRIPQPSKTIQFLETGQNIYLAWTQLNQVYFDAPYPKGSTVAGFFDGHTELVTRERLLGPGPSGSAPAQWPAETRLMWFGDPDVVTRIKF